MYWLLKIAGQPPRVAVLTKSRDGTISVNIENRGRYWYSGEVSAVPKLEALCNAGAYGRALQWLRDAFELLEKPDGLVDSDL